MKSTSTLITSLTALLCLYMFCVSAITYEDFLSMDQSLGTSDTLISRGGKFELVFFSKGRESTTKYYVGIRNKKVPKDRFVWVSNRDYAFPKPSAALTIQADGNIVIRDGPMTYKVSNVSNNSITCARLLDSGNLLLVNNSSQMILWRFDNPTNTLLPGMNLGYDNHSGYTWSLRSWRSADDPTPGTFSFKYDYGKTSLIINSSSKVFWIDDHSNDTIDKVISRSGVIKYRRYFTWPVGSRLVLEVSGEINKEYWSKKAKRWVPIQSSKCGTNNLCGDFSICNPQARNPCDVSGKRSYRPAVTVLNLMMYSINSIMCNYYQF